MPKAAWPAPRQGAQRGVLNTAKQALIGYVAAQAIKAGENSPGALPCPEAPADFNDSPRSEGTVSLSLHAADRRPLSVAHAGPRQTRRCFGRAALVCRVATGWAGANTVINSDCASPASGMACATGRLTVDGVANDVIALIIAPGPRLECVHLGELHGVEPGAGRPRARPTGAITSNARTPPGRPDATFATTGPERLVQRPGGRHHGGATSCPASRPPIAKRIEREIVPQLQTVYAGTAWGLTAGIAPLSVRGAVRQSRAGRRHLELRRRGRHLPGTAAVQPGRLHRRRRQPALPAGGGAHQLGDHARRLRREAAGATSRPSRAGRDRQCGARLRGRVPRERQLPVQPRDAHRDAGHAPKRRHGPAPLRHDADADRSA